MKKKYKKYLIVVSFIILISLFSFLIFNTFKEKSTSGVSDNNFLSISDIPENTGGKGMKNQFLAISYSCDDPRYPVDCGSNVCGSSRAWCDNYNDGGSHCKPNDPDWCCYDSGYIYCQDNICGPNRDFCDNLRNADKSCNLDRSRCCSVSGSIYQYKFDVCCPSTSPFSNGQYCSAWNYFAESDNYYTRNSKCSPQATKCEGITYFECIGTNFIYDYQSKGAVVGKCGVECTSGQEKCSGSDYLVCDNYKYLNRGKVLNKCEVNCLSNNECISALTLPTTNFCDGKNLMKNNTNSICSNYKCQIEINSQLVQTCDYRCGVKSDSDLSECIDRTYDEIKFYRNDGFSCKEVGLLPDEKTEKDFEILEDCKESLPFYVKLSFWLVVIPVILIISVYFIFRKYLQKFYRKHF